MAGGFATPARGDVHALVGMMEQGVAAYAARGFHGRQPEVCVACVVDKCDTRVCSI